MFFSRDLLLFHSKAILIMNSFSRLGRIWEKIGDQEDLASLRFASLLQQTLILLDWILILIHTSN